MPHYYNKVIGNLADGDIAKAGDINNIQTNVSDAIEAAIDDHHEHMAYILGDDKDAFKLTPAPKRLGRYIDTMNLVSDENEIWLSIRKWGYRQKIKKSKSSIYSIICKFRNLSNQPITVWCRLENDIGMTIGRTSIEIPKNTNSAEFEIIFEDTYISTAPGLSHEDIEPFDSKYVAPPPREESFEQGISHANNFDAENFTIGASQLYFYIESLNIDETDIAVNGDEYNIITDETFAVLADKSGSYGKLLEQTGGLDYAQTQYDLHFKDVYATTSTYLCKTGEAIIAGQKVKCMDTHISIAGANNFGDVKTYVYMDIDGHLRAINSPAFFSNDEEAPLTELPSASLPIAIITTYMNDAKSPTVYQDDESLIVRPRSHHERLRRAERKIKYLDDISIPPRLKYTYSGIDLVDENPEGEVGQIDGGKYYVTTNAKGDVIVKNSEAEVITIPITLKTDMITDDTKTIEGNESDNSSSDASKNAANIIYNDASLAATFAEIKEMTYNKEDGTLKLKTTQEKTKGTVGMTDDEAKETEFNPWDDDASNRPTNSDIKPTEREYTITKGKNGANDWSSEFPAMTFYTDKDYTLSGLYIPITKFKNCESIKFVIWKRQGPNNKTNTVWLEKKIYTSESFSLKNAKEKDGYQIVEDGFTIKIDKGLSLPKGQYIIACIHNPKEGSGSCFVETYKPNDPKDFCIRYYGAADASHFLLKERYHEVWYNSATFKGTEAKLAKEGQVVSGTVTWTNSEPITSIIASANITTPEKCEYELYADTGGGYQKLELDKATAMTGGGVSFKWKLVFKGDGDTPTLAYDEKKGYAIQFTITKKQPGVGTYNDTNDCITTKTFRAEEILKEYIGDPNFNKTNDRFSNYEFARVWGYDYDSINNLIIDIAASDETASITYPVTTNGTTTNKTIDTDIFSFIYADLELDDFNTTSVEYSNYDSSVEYDEHNLRLKLDTQHSYNDSNIDIKQSKSDITDTYMNGNDNNQDFEFSKGATYPENKILYKYNPANGFVDLSKYTGLKIKFLIYGTAPGEDLSAVKGLGLYISSAKEEDAPSIKEDLSNEDIIPLGVGDLPDLNKEKDEIISDYYGKIIEKEYVQNGVTYRAYFRYVKDNKGKYSIQQVHNLKSYVMYYLPTLKFAENPVNTPGTGDYSRETTQYVEVEIDSNDVNLSRVQEIGLVALVDEELYEVVNTCRVNVHTIKAIEKDYYPIYDPNTDVIFKPFREDLASTANETNHYSSILQTEKLPTGAKRDPQKRNRIDIYFNRIAADGEILAYYPIDKNAINYKHLGVQLAANCWIPKNALELHLCSDNRGQQSVYSLRIPTLNTIHDPVSSTITQNKDNGFVKFSQIFKKISKDISIKSISIRATTRFKEYMKQIRVKDSSGYISLYIGKIVLYKAETIPIFHKNMRFKIYNNDMGSSVNAGIRKVGCVLEYK